MASLLREDNIYNTREQIETRYALARIFEDASNATAEKLSAFSKYIARQDLSLFLARYEIFKQILDVKGSIVECGVYLGNGFMTYAQLSAALEPTNYNRRIIGFDTFAGNKAQSADDEPGKAFRSSRQAKYCVDSEKEIRECIKVYDQNRFLNHLPKCELVRGDIVDTASEYLKNNPHTLISLLELTVNLYKPTEAALKEFLPRMPKGAIVVFGTLNEGIFPGVTLALLKKFDINRSGIRSFPFAPNLSYTVI